SFQVRLKGAQDAFVTKLDPTGRIVFSTYLGGSGVDNLSAVEMDADHNIYVAGQTASLDFPTTFTGFEPLPIVPLWNNDGPGAFVAKISPDGTGLLYSSFLPSFDRSAQQSFTHLAVAPSGDAYVTGLTGATFPITASAPQPCFDGPIFDAFVAHLNPQ